MNAKRLQFLNVANMDVSVRDIKAGGREKGITIPKNHKVILSEEAFIEQQDNAIFDEAYLVYCGIEENMPEALKENPNHLRDGEIKKLLKGKNSGIVEKLDSIKSKITLVRVLNMSDRKGVNEKIEKRLQVDFGMIIDKS